MRLRRLLPYSLAILAALVLGSVVYVTKPFAQEEAAPPPDTMGGSAGSVGEAGGAPAGGGGGPTFSWTETKMPDDLVMNYGEFLVQEGQAPVPIPEFYLLEDDGTPKKLTRNEWYGLARIYADHPLGTDRLPIGTPGGDLWNQVYLEAAVKHNEVNAIWNVWAASVDAFTFQTGYPRIGPQMLQYDWTRKAMRNPDGTIRYGRWEATLPDRFQIVVPVIMRVKEDVRQGFGRRFFTAMKRFDNMGDGRSPFKFMTFEGGHFQPTTFYLADEAIRMWEDLWTRLRVQLRLFDTESKQIAFAEQGSGISPSIFTQLVHPPVIRYQPRYRLLMPGEDDKFKGGRLNLEGTEGWYFEYSFTLTRDQLKSLNNAEARLTINGGPAQRMKSFGAMTASAPAGGGAPGGMSGGPTEGMSPSMGESGGSGVSGMETSGGPAAP
jgi:hypothetical protein